MAATHKQGRKRGYRDESGRLHLAIQRDEATGRERLELEAPLFDQSWQDELVASAANTALALLAGDPTRQRVIELTRSAMASTSRLVDALLARAPRGAVACKAGCGHCCHVLVSVTAPEALTILDHLKSSLSAAALNRLRTRVTEFCTQTRGLSAAERFSPDLPCVFLDDDRCSIYPVRPFACRGMNSLDAGECETRLHDPEVRAAFVANGGGRLFVEPIQAFRAVTAGLQLALKELFHLDMRPLELTAAIRIFLQGDESVVDEWLAGGRLVPRGSSVASI
jgi:Fe-S-cluster containining protein